MVHNEKQYDKYLRNGKEIFEAYCSTEDKYSIMLPRAPQHTYIDLYPEEDQPGCSFTNDRNQQLNYEAEVKVYRALEKLQENLIVLHSFEYTHFQYHLGDSSHDKRKCVKCKKSSTNREGECDFIVIASNYFVIIEVKNMGHIGEVSDPGCNRDQQLQALAKTFKKSLEQRKRMIELIKRFCKRLTVLQFTVYPNFERAFKSEFQINRDQRCTVIVKEDIEDFSNWWEGNVSDLVLDEPMRPEFRKKHEDVRSLLLAMWCTDKNNYDMTRCSLEKCILNVDDQLRSGKFRFRSNNPGVVPTPDFVREYMGVDNLTKEQHDILNSNEKFLWINAPAGTGKTVVLMAKILELVLSNKDNKVVVFSETCVREGVTSSEHLHKPLEKAGVMHVVGLYNDIDINASQMYGRIAEDLRYHQVVIFLLQGFHDDGFLRHPNAESLKNLLGLLQGVHVFFDDIQHLFSHCDDEDYPMGKSMKCYNHLPEILKNLFHQSSSHYVWIACDTVQNVHGDLKQMMAGFQEPQKILAKFFKDKLSSSQVVSLSKNLRYTYNLWYTLSIIREKINEKTQRLPKSWLMNESIPGHYIYGPKVDIHVVQKFDKDQLYDIFSKQFDELMTAGMMDKNDVGVIFTMVDSGTASLVKDMVYTRILQPKGMTPKLCLSTYSKEWPAVIVLQTLSDPYMNDTLNMMKLVGSAKLGDTSSDTELLYLAMSRARVKCTVIMFPEEGYKFDDCHRMKDLLDKLKDSVEIRRYSSTSPALEKVN